MSEKVKLKYLCDIYNGNSIPDNEKDFYTNKKIPYIPTKEIDAQNHSINYNNGLTVNEGDGFRIAPKDSVLLCIEGGSAGKKIAYIEKDVAFVNKLCCLKLKNGDSRYLFYALQSYDFLSLFSLNLSGLIGGVSINALKNIPISIYDYTHQNKISNILEKKINQIDTLISNQDKQIEKLKEYKQALIAKVVTKGLNLDIKMKDSGEKEIGLIPNSWKLLPTKSLFFIIAGGTPNSGDNSNFDEDILWVTPADFKTEDVFTLGGRRNLSKKGYDSCSATIVPKGSIIFSKRAPIGSVVINSVPLCTNQGCLSCVKRIKEINIKYFYYVMAILTNSYELLGTGTTFKEISAKNFSLVKLPVPPYDEQNNLAKYLDEKCAFLDKIIKIKKTKIDLLQNYKKSIIYEYVTGKKEVQL